MSFAKCLLVALAAVASVSALVTPHAARHTLHHRALAARVAEPRSANTTVHSPTTARKRCRPRPASSSLSASKTATATLAANIVNAAPIPSSTHVTQPTTTQPAPKPTAAAPAPVPAPTTKAATPTPPASSGGGVPAGFLSGIQSGDGTFYQTGLGACGITNDNDQKIAAVSHLLFDNFPGYNGVNPNTNPVCGKQIRATRNGASVVITVTDRCAACLMTDLDFAPAAFDALTAGDEALGRVKIEWSWV